MGDVALITDGWERWQQGGCGTYAVALITASPTLRFGVLGVTENGGGDASNGWTPTHFFAHDDVWAYDSAGRHPIPYRGVHGQCDYLLLDQDVEDYGVLEDEAGPDGIEADLAAAAAHARRHGIL